MDIYRLSNLGYALAHSVRGGESGSPNATVKWKIIYYLNKQHSASRDKIMIEVPGASPFILGNMVEKKILINESGVSV